MTRKALRTGPRHRAGLIPRAAAVAACALALAAPAPADEPITTQPDGDDVATLLEIAAKAYEQGQCAQVLAALDEAERQAAERIDGVSYYRWGYCASIARRSDAEARYLTARERLDEAARAEDAILDVHFYRVNALINLQLNEDARAAAREAVDRWKAGRVVVPVEEPQAWFRLGKLFGDAGEPRGAMEPFSRALDLVERGKGTLREAYVERIARAAVEAGDDALVARATAQLRSSEPTSPQELLRRARVEVGAGELETARDLFRQARSAGGDLGMRAQYAAESVRRALAAKRTGFEPASELPDGRSIAGLTLEEIRSEIAGLAGPIAEALNGPAVEVPRRSGQGTKPAPAPETEQRLGRLQSLLAGLLLEAVRRDAPLREWAVSGGFAHLIHYNLTRLFVKNRLKLQAAEEQGRAARPGEGGRQ